MASAPADTLPPAYSVPMGLGFSVIPVEPRGKVPSCAWKRWQAEKADRETVSSWAMRPGNVGIVTGQISGLLVLDLDSDEAVTEAERRGIPATIEATTGKGRHVYFRHPGGVIGNRASLFPGADIRGDGGYIVAPGSIHPNGTEYRWRNPPGLFDLAEPPAWLLDLLAKPEPAPAAPIQPRPITASSTYGERAVDGELASLRRAQEGERNHALNRAAFNLGQLAAGGVIDETSTLAHLRATAAAIGLDAQEIERTLASGWAAGTEKPRGVPERKPEARPAPEPEQHFDPETGEVFEHPEPVDLWARYEEPPLPTGLLPDAIENFAVNQAEIMGADPAGLAMAALTVCGAALPDAIALQVKRNDPTWQENARLWVAMVGPPSRKKTPIFKAALAPLRAMDNTLMRAYMAQLRDYEALPPAERKTAARPVQRRHIISDATVEAAQEVLRDSPNGVLSEQDELSGFFGAMDKYAPGKGAQADRGFWLKSFNGGTYNLNRIGRGASQIPNLSVSLLGGIQPEPIRKIAADTVDDGLVQRLLPVILRPSTTGRDTPADGSAAAYARLVERLAVMRPLSRNGLAQPFETVPVQMSSDAKAIRERLEQEHLDLVNALETASPKLSAHFGKFDGIFARLCLLWACIEADGTCPPAEISGDVAERVARFMADFIRPSSIAFYAGLLGMSAGHEDLVALAALIVAKRLDEVKARDVQRSGQALRHVQSDQVRLLCEKLEAFGWVERADPGPKSNTIRWLVNPRVHERFADRAAQEVQRREAARLSLRNALGG